MKLIFFIFNIDSFIESNIWRRLCYGWCCFVVVNRGRHFFWVLIDWRRLPHAMRMCLTKPPQLQLFTSRPIYNRKWLFALMWLHVRWSVATNQKMNSVRHKCLFIYSRATNNITYLFQTLMILSIPNVTFDPEYRDIILIEWMFLKHASRGMGEWMHSFSWLVKIIGLTCKGRERF